MWRGCYHRDLTVSLDRAEGCWESMGSEAIKMKHAAAANLARSVSSSDYLIGSDEQAD